MTGAVSRASLAQARERFLAALPTADLTTIGGELFAVLALLDGEPRLRRALTDPSRDGDAKAQLVQVMLEGKVSATALTAVAEVARQRWSRPSELSSAIEVLAVTAEAARAQADGRLEDLEDELFRFSRVVAREPELRAALSDQSLPADRRRGLVAALLEGRASASTLELVTELVLRPRSRRLEAGLADFGKVVAQYRQRLVAVVRTAVPLTELQRTRLAAVLTAAYGHEVHLNIELDPKAVGGLSIQLGDEIIDGTIAGRLDEVRRRLAAS